MKSLQAILVFVVIGRLSDGTESRDRMPFGRALCGPITMNDRLDSVFTFRRSRSHYDPN
jgi:hypothetical protein